MGKLTISMAMFNSYVSHYQAGYLIVAILCLQGIPKAPSQTISSCLQITHSKSWVMMVMGHGEFLTGLDSATAFFEFGLQPGLSTQMLAGSVGAEAKAFIILIETCWKRPGMGIYNHLHIAWTCLQQRLVCGVKVPNSRKHLWLTLQLKKLRGVGCHCVITEPCQVKLESLIRICGWNLTKLLN